MHALQTIAETGSRPMTKAPLRIESRDDRMMASTLAAEVMAHAKGDANKWLNFAWRAIDMTVEARAAFLNIIKAEKAAMTKAQNEHGIDDKTSRKRTNSFAVQVSMLQQVANAWNSGATLEGLAQYINDGIKDSTKHAQVDHIRDHVGWVALVEYARTFSQSQAGRKPDTLMVKLAKFLKNNAPNPDADASEQRLYEQLVEISNKVNAA